MEQEQQNSNQELENVELIDWNELTNEFPLAINALKEWFLDRIDIPNAEVIIEQHSILLTNGQGGLYLSPRDLYDFFDSYDIRPFVIPKDSYPNTTYLIQSKKSIKESEMIFNNRVEAEIAMFKETFFFIEVTVQREKQ